jgi:hypothetical protein
MSKKKETRTIRETTCKWEFNNEDGDLESKEIRINYFSPTVAQLKADRLAEEARIDKDPTSVIWITDILGKTLHSLHELPVTPSTPKSVVIAPSIEWLDEQDLRNLTTVREAIDEDLKAGKSQPAK